MFKSVLVVIRIKVDGSIMGYNILENKLTEQEFESIISSEIDEIGDDLVGSISCDMPEFGIIEANLELKKLASSHNNIGFYTLYFDENGNFGDYGSYC